MPRPTALHADLAALAAGLCWGLARPDLTGAALAVLGAFAAGHSVRGERADVGRGLLVGLVWRGIGASWVAPALTSWGYEHAARAGAALVLVQGGLVALPWATAAVLRARGWTAGAALGVSFAALHPLIDHLSPIPCPPTILLAGLPAALAPAAWGGVPLTDALLLTTAGHPSRWRGGLLLLWFGLAAFPLPPSGAPVRARIVQPDVTPEAARTPSTTHQRADDLLTHLRAGDSALTVAPESAWPLPPADLPRDLPATVVGAWDGQQHLVLVGEGDRWTRLPKRAHPPITERAPDGVASRPGPGVSALIGLRVGVLLCYEDLDGPSVRATLAARPDLLVLPANDGFTGGTAGSDWHLAQATLTAVMSGRDVLRPTLSGHSAAIRADGARLWTSGPPRPGGQSAVVEVHARQPRWNGALGASLVSFGALLLLAANVTRHALAGRRRTG